MTKKNLRQHFYSLLFVLVFMTSCNGQKKPPLSEANQETNKLTALPDNQKVKADTVGQLSEYVVEVFEDSKGNLWFGTMSDGAIRFDGKILTYLSTKDGLCDNTVASIAEDREGNIWFGTHAGASRYNGKSFTNFTEKNGLSGKGCKILVDKKGQIWAGTNDGAFRYNGFSFMQFNIPNPDIKNPSRKWVLGKVWGIIEDKAGNIWFGRDGLGACKFDGTNFTHFTEKDGLCSNNVSEIIEDKQGNFWFACLSYDLPKPIAAGGICRYDGKVFTKFPNQKGLSKNDIYSIYADTKSNIWIGATGLGVYQYDGDSFKFYKGTDRMDLTWSVGIQSILEDSKGMLWFGFSGGLFRFKDATIKNVSKTELLKSVKY
jgi:ligand-binding sensor domain-containing protein